MHTASCSHVTPIVISPGATCKSNQSSNLSRHESEESKEEDFFTPPTESITKDPNEESRHLAKVFGGEQASKKGQSNPEGNESDENPSASSEIGVNQRTTKGRETGCDSLISEMLERQSQNTDEQFSGAADLPIVCVYK